jgi:hypothetical protein
MTTITKETYTELFAAFLREKGPNPATSFFGAWAWHSKKEKQFKKKLRKENIIVE